MVSDRFLTLKILIFPLFLLHPQVQPALASCSSEALRRCLMVTLFGKWMFLRVYLIWMMMIIIIVLFLLVCCCLRHRNLYYCNTSSLILVYPQGKGNPTELGNRCFLAEPLGCSRGTAGGEIPSLGLGLADPLEHHPTLWGLLWPCRGTSIARRTAFEGFWWQAAQLGWLGVFDGSASVPGGGIRISCILSPGAAAAAPEQGLVVWHCGDFRQTPPWGLCVHFPGFSPSNTLLILLLHSQQRAHLHIPIS